MATNKRYSDYDRSSSPEHPTIKKLRPGGGRTRIRAHSTNNSRVSRMSHIRVKSEESDDDSLFVPPTYRPRVQVLIEAAKLRKSQSATPAPTPTPTRITHVDGEEDEDDHLMASIEQEDVQSAYEDANTHVDGDVEMSACDADEERERDSVTPGPFNGEVDPGVSCVRIARPNTTSAERASAAAAEVHTPAGMARLGVPVSGPFSAPASFSPAFSRSSVLSDRQLADVAAIRERIQKAKEMKAAKDKEKEVDLMVIENAQEELTADHRAEMEALQKELDEANEALRMTEEESKKIKVERDRVETELWVKRGDLVRVKVEGMDY